MNNKTITCKHSFLYDIKPLVYHGGPKMNDNRLPLLFTFLYKKYSEVSNSRTI